MKHQGGWNKGQIKSRLNLERALRAGRKPTDIGATQLGKGAQNVAYVIQLETSKYVIKMHVGKFQGFGRKNEIAEIPEELKAHIAKYGIRLARTSRAKQWEIQELSTPIALLSKEDRAKYAAEIRNYHRMRDEASFHHDMHEMNVGIVEIDGRVDVIVFDC